MTELSTRSTAEVLNVRDAKRIITVIAVPWGQPTSVPFQGGVWQESFVRGAFTGPELRNPERVRVNRDHERSRVVGKVVNLDPNDSRGLIAETRIARTPLGDETLALAEEDMLSASVGFGTYEGGDILNHRTKTRQVTRAWLDHIALTPAPAYAGARVVGVRAATPNLNEALADPIFDWTRRHLRRVSW